MKHETEFERDDGSVVTVEYTISAYDPGISSGPAEDCYPPEGGEVEIISVKNADGEKVVTTDDEDEKWSTWIMENHDHDTGHDDYYEDRD